MQNQENRLSLKDKLDIAEAICTIIVTVMALWGTIVAAQHDLFHKLGHIIEHYHTKIEQEEHAYPSDTGHTHPSPSENS